MVICHFSGKRSKGIKICYKYCKYCYSSTYPMSAIMPRNFIYIIFKPYNHLKYIYYHFHWSSKNSTIISKNILLFNLQIKKLKLGQGYTAMVEPGTVLSYVCLQSLHLCGVMEIFNGSPLAVPQCNSCPSGVMDLMGTFSYPWYWMFSPLSPTTPSHLTPSIFTDINIQKLKSRLLKKMLDI